MTNSAEGAEGSLSEDKEDDRRTQRLDRLQKLSSFDKQKGDHNRQLRTIASIDSKKVRENHPRYCL